MKIKKFTFNIYQENTYLVINKFNECIIIDPGCSTIKEKIIINEYITKNKLNIKYIINTHFHIDHVVGNKYLKTLFPEAVLAFPLEEKYLLNQLKDIFSQKATNDKNHGLIYEHIEPDQYLREGDTISILEIKFKIISVPGHSPGHIMLYDKVHNLNFVGDILFNKSIGRGDLPGGNSKQLIKNIKDKILILDEKTQLHPGHGGATTIGYEKNNNPFLIDNIY